MSSLRNEEVTIDYRASNLSSILKDAFVGNSFTTSIITASPSSLEIFDTFKVIQFGKKLQAIKKTVTISRPIRQKDEEIDTAELQGKYMSSQSEAIFLKSALSEEKSRVQKLSAEKAHLEKLLSQAQTNNNHDDSSFQQGGSNTSNMNGSLRSSESDLSNPKSKANTDSDALISPLHVSMAATVGQQWYRPTRK